MAVENSNYIGNANLGLGANPQIPVTTQADLNYINQTTDRLLANNLQRNRAQFEIKKREQDKLYQALDSGDIKTGDLLEQDMPVVKEGLDALDKAWEARIERGVNDLDAQRDYKKALREAQDRVTQAQMRKLFFDRESGLLSQEKLPRKQTARQQHIDNSLKKGFWADVTPYQQTQDLDIDGSILSTAANITSQYTDPKNPLMKGKRTVFDWDKTLAANKDNFLNDVNKRHDQQQLLDAIQGQAPRDFVDTVKAINNRIKEYNDLKGLTADDEGFVTDVAFEVDPNTGRPMIRESLPDFAAKFTLAHQKPFGSTTTEFDKDLANYKLGLERNRIAGANAAANGLRARTYAALQKKKLQQLTEREKDVKNIWDNIVDHVGENPAGGGLKKLMSFFGRGKGSVPDYLPLSDIPEGYQNIAGLDAKGLPIKLKPLMINGKPGYGTKYYTTDGKEMNNTEIRKKYDEYKESGETYNDYLRKLIRQGVLDLELVGQNGVGNIQTAGETTRALNSKLTSKGETPVFTEETITEEEP